MENNIPNINQVFLALADKNRRKIVELLHKGESTLLELSRHFSISFQALSKHIKVLEKANILEKEKSGKYYILSLKRETLKPPLKWISYYANFWNESFDKLENIINQKNARGDAE